jgi:hypothetical protein
MTPEDKAQTPPDITGTAFWQLMQEREERLLQVTERLDHLLAQTESEEKSDAPEEVAEEKSSSRFSIIVGFLTQVATLIVIWIALFQNNLEPGDASINGISAAFNRQLVENISYSDLYAQYRAYTAYTLNYELQQQLELALANPSEETSSEELLLLNRELEQARRTAASSRLFFASRYLNPDGSYDRERQLGEAWSQAARQTDLDPKPYFVEADEQRRLGVDSIGLLLWLTVALCLCELIIYFNRRRLILRWSSVFATVAGIVFVIVVMISLM